jgi:hypothetical protein
MSESKFIIRIFEEVGGDSAISVEDGDAIFKKIDNAISNGMSVTLDFQNIKLIITAFLNAAIGQLYSKYNSEQLNDKLNIENISSEDIRLFKKVIERAKEYFSNPDEFKSTVDNSL